MPHWNKSNPKQRVLRELFPDIASFKFPVLPQKEDKLPSFLCPVIAAICQASSLVQNNSSTVKQGFYPTLIYKQLFQEKKKLKNKQKRQQKEQHTTHLLEYQISSNV